MRRAQRRAILRPGLWPGPWPGSDGGHDREQGRAGAAATPAERDAVQQQRRNERGVGGTHAEGEAEPEPGDERLPYVVRLARALASYIVRWARGAMSYIVRLG